MIYVAKSMACRGTYLYHYLVILSGMGKHTGSMHVAKVSKKYVTKDGVSRESVAYLLRRTYRDGVTVKHETLANLSPLPDAAIEAVRAALAGKTLVVAGEGLEVTGSLPHGHVAAVHAQAKALGLPALLGPAGRERDIALALIIARVCRPASKLATTRWWADTTLAAYTSSVVASATPRSAANVVSAHHRVVASLELGRHTRAMIRANAMSRSRPAGPNKAGSPSALAWAWTAATCPCGNERVTSRSWPGTTSA